MRPWQIEVRIRRLLATTLQISTSECDAFAPGEDLGSQVDSLDIAELTIAMEEEFDIELGDYALACGPGVPWSIARLVEIVESAMEPGRSAA